MPYFYKSAQLLKKKIVDIFIDHNLFVKKKIYGRCAKSINIYFQLSFVSCNAIEI